MAMPMMRVRVVCALGLTIATFWPTSALTSVDLPAFGAPTIAMRPQRWVMALPSSPRRRGSSSESGLDSRLRGNDEKAEARCSRQILQQFRGGGGLRLLLRIAFRLGR